MEMLPIQNKFNRKFTVLNDLHPRKNNQSVYQIFATVSAVFRREIIVGLKTCCSYEQYQLKKMLQLPAL